MKYILQLTPPHDMVLHFSLFLYSNQELSESPSEYAKITYYFRHTTSKLWQYNPLFLNKRPVTFYTSTRLNTPHRLAVSWPHLHTQ